MPLNPNGFEYPITSLTLDIIVEGEMFAEGIVINESYYDVYDGALYFNSTLENIISHYYEGWEEELGRNYAEELLSNTIYYNLHITFNLVVPDTSEETSMWALSQAIHYSIMDYFNQYEYARATAKSS